MSDRFDAVATLLEEFGFYMSSLEIRMNAPLDRPARAIVVNILTGMLHPFATLTNMMHETRASELSSCDKKTVLHAHTCRTLLLCSFRQCKSRY